MLSKSSSELTRPVKIHFKASTFCTIQVDNLIVAAADSDGDDDDTDDGEGTSALFIS